MTIIPCNRTDSVKIYLDSPDLLPSVQVPAQLIVGVDAALREMTRRGETSPELALVVQREKYPADGLVWLASYGDVHAWGVTPWAALAKLGEALRKAGDQ